MTNNEKAREINRHLAPGTNYAYAKLFSEMGDTVIHERARIIRARTRRGVLQVKTLNSGLWFRTEVNEVSLVF